MSWSEHESASGVEHEAPKRVYHGWNRFLISRYITGLISRRTGPNQISILGTVSWQHFLAAAILLMSGAANEVVGVESLRLRLDAGLSSTVWRMGMDDRGRYLVTGSADKQVLVWSLDSDRDPAVLRVPIRDESKNRAHPVAISPNAELVVYGVPTGASPRDPAARLYVFDRMTQRVKHVVKDLDTRPQAVAFSPNGEFLAASLSEGYGLRVWSTESWKLNARFDPINDLPASMNHGQHLQKSDFPGLAFNPIPDADVGLVMVGGGGIALFGPPPHFRLREWFPTAESFDHVAFSPDGERVALGNRSTTTLLLMRLGSAVAFEPLPAPPATHGFSRSQFLSRVAWSNDGRFLYAGGLYWTGDPTDGDLTTGIVQWNVKDTKKTIVLPAGTNTVMDIIPYGKDGILYVTQDPFIGGYDGNGDAIKTDRLPIKAQGFDFRYWKEKRFYTSSQGDIIAFSPYREPHRLIKFDLNHQTVEEIDQLPNYLADTAAGSDDFNARNMRNVPVSPFDKRVPSVNNRDFSLSPKNISRDYAELPSGKTFLWLTSDWLRHMHVTGRQYWQTDLQHEGYRVLTANAGKLAIVGHSDGTFRWYETDTGKHILTLFIQRQEKRTPETNSDWRWIAWTPEGYYMASPRGEELAGWLINNPEDSDHPIYYDFGRFRNIFYRPDVIKLILRERDTAAALRKAGHAAGFGAGARNIHAIESLLRGVALPEIAVISPHQMTPILDDAIEVKYRLHSASGVIPDEVDIYIDASLVKRIKRDIRLNEDLATTVTLPNFAIKHGQEFRLTLTATKGRGENRQRALPVTESLVFTGETRPPRLPRLVGLAVGISKYENLEHLEFADADASEIKAFWDTQKGKLYRDVKMDLIPETETYKANILRGLERLSEEAGPDDIAFLFFSGHGATLPIEDRFVYLYFTRNADASHFADSSDPAQRAKLLETSISGDELSEILGEMRARNKIIFLDTCRELPFSNGIDTIQLQSEVRESWYSYVFFSTDRGKFSYERRKYGHGIFTKALLEGLRGKADTQMGVNEISFSELDLFVHFTVRMETNDRQAPMMMVSIPVQRYRHQPLVLVKEGSR